MIKLSPKNASQIIRNVHHQILSEMLYRKIAQSYIVKSLATQVISLWKKAFCEELCLRIALQKLSHHRAGASRIFGYLCISVSRIKPANFAMSATGFGLRTTNRRAPFSDFSSSRSGHEVHRLLKLRHTSTE